MPTMTVPSAAIRRLRREGLEIRRRREALAPTGGVVAKKPSPPPPGTVVLGLPAPLPRPSTAAPTTTRPPAPRRAAGGDGARRLERARPAVPPYARPCSSHATAAPAEVVVGSKRVGKGAQVRVRTRVGTARTTGQPIVLWLRAVVDSAADEDGYLRVTYSNDINGKLPRVACVAHSDIRLHDVVPLGDSRGDGSARPPPEQNKVAPPRARPLLKKFEKEMKRRSKAIIGRQ